MQLSILSIWMTRRWIKNVKYVEHLEFFLMPCILYSVGVVVVVVVVGGVVEWQWE